MKATAPAKTRTAQNGNSVPAVARRHTAISRAPSGHLAQLAAMANRSPRVQAQFKLAEEVQNGGRVVTQRELAQQINQSESCQMRVDQTPRGDHEEQPVAQLYHNLDDTPVTGYGKGVGGNAPTFEFQEFSATTNHNAAASTATYGVDAAQVFENAPNLRVSDNNDMAVPNARQAEAKQFFATAAKIQESNKLLHDSGSPLRLTQGAGQVTVPAAGQAAGASRSRPT